MDKQSKVRKIIIETIEIDAMNIQNDPIYLKVSYDPKLSNALDKSRKLPQADFMVFKSIIILATKLVSAWS